MKNFMYLLLIFSFPTYGQEIKGYLYDSDGRVPNIPVWNVTQNKNTGADSNGYFAIAAEIGDTVLFTSVAYNKYKLVVENEHFKEEIVVVLTYNNLDEVTVNSYNIKFDDFENSDRELMTQIRRDIIKNPTLYEPHKGNIRYLIQNIIGLFGGKDKAKEQQPENGNIVTRDFMYLFEDDIVLNKTFLLEELQIPTDYHNLFMEYLGSKQYSITYLREDKKLDLIQAVYESGKEYKAIINSSH